MKTSEMTIFIKKINRNYILIILYYTKSVKRPKQIKVTTVYFYTIMITETSLFHWQYVNIHKNNGLENSMFLEYCSL